MNIDLTPIRDGTGPARPLDMVGVPLQGRVQDMARRRTPAVTRRDAGEVVAMDGFTGFKTATVDDFPAAVAVMDAFHVLRLCGEALDRCRRRVLQDLHGHRGLAGDPLCGARRTLHTGLLTDRQRQRLILLFDDDHVWERSLWGRSRRPGGSCSG